MLHQQPCCIVIALMNLSPFPQFEDAERALRAKGARVTSARVRVLSTLRTARSPMSHSDIETEMVREGAAAIDRVTLYRILDWLSSAGLAHKAVDSRGVYRFSAAEPAVEHHSHVHFRCTDCGKVFCLPEPAPEPPALPEGFRLSGLDLDVRGECRDCAERHGQS
jgi:Fur family ferric uptake transcriptional regulator